jgi:hypothetical protein
VRGDHDAGGLVAGHPGLGLKHSCDE